MKKNKTIRRFLVLAVWFLLLTGVATLLIAANRKQKEHVCKRIVVSIKALDERFFVEEKDIYSQMERTTGGRIEGRPLKAVPVALLEKSLELNPWIKNAELYFDREDVLHVSILEREPIARVFTPAGRSFYIDSTGNQMPLLEKVSIKLPVFTGFPDQLNNNGGDSILLVDVKRLAAYIYQDKFWSEQIGEIDITPSRNFEMIPTVGSHIIRVGDGSDIDKKLERLMVFYKQVLNKIGFNKYSYLDVQFNGQVVAVKKMPASAVDSIQLQKNIEDLLHKSTIQNLSEDMLPSKPLNGDPGDSIMAHRPILENNLPVKPASNPLENKPNTISPKQEHGQHKPVGKPERTLKPGKKPKALMPKLRHP